MSSRLSFELSDESSDALSFEKTDARSDEASFEMSHRRSYEVSFRVSVLRCFPANSETSFLTSLDSSFEPRASGFELPVTSSGRRMRTDLLRELLGSFAATPADFRATKTSTPRADTRRAMGSYLPGYSLSRTAVAGHPCRFGRGWFGIADSPPIATAAPLIRGKSTPDPGLPGSALRGCAQRALDIEREIAILPAGARWKRTRYRLGHFVRLQPDSRPAVTPFSLGTAEARSQMSEARSQKCGQQDVQQPLIRTFPVDSSVGLALG